MTYDEFIAALEKAVDVDPGTFKSGKVLDDIVEWDSLAVLEYQALADEELGLDLEAEQVHFCKTFDDLMALVADRLDG